MSIKLGLTGLSKNAEELKQSYVEGWGIDPEKKLKNLDDCPTEADSGERLL